MSWHLKARVRAFSAAICLTSTAVISAAAARSPAVEVVPTKAPVDDNTPPKVCLGCHGLGALAHMRQGENGWRAIVDYMVLHGAYMTPAEYEAAIGWLTRNYGLTTPREAPVSAASKDPEFDLVVRKCTSCHDLERVTVRRRTPAAWSEIIAQMRAIGAPVSDNEATRIIRYLGKSP